MAMLSRPAAAIAGTAANSQGQGRFRHPLLHRLAQGDRPLAAFDAGTGEIDFGQAMLSWSDKGLALATIGQDYYDLDLSPMTALFP